MTPFLSYLSKVLVVQKHFVLRRLSRKQLRLEKSRKTTRFMTFAAFFFTLEWLLAVGKIETAACISTWCHYTFFKCKVHECKSLVKVTHNCFAPIILALKFNQTTSYFFKKGDLHMSQL